MRMAHMEETKSVHISEYKWAGNMDPMPHIPYSIDEHRAHANNRNNNKNSRFKIRNEY